MKRPQKLRGHHGSDVVGIPGYGLIDRDAIANREFQNWTEEEWRTEFARTRECLTTFLRVRDPFTVLAKTSMRHMIGAGKERSPQAQEELPPLEQAEVELVQALLLTQDGPQRGAPTSPRNFVRFWHLLGRHISSFIRKQPEKPSDKPIVEFISRRARVYTIYYRNLFVKEDCEETLLSLLARVDEISDRELGYKLFDAYRALLRILNIVTQRLDTFAKCVRDLYVSKDRQVVLDSIAFFAAATPLAGRLWRWGGHRFTDLEGLKAAGFQMSEMASAWIYTLPRALLAAEFSPEMLGVIDQLSIKRGELANINLEHIYMNNPVWRRPFVALEDGNLFAALPQMAVSFPFAMMEGLMKGHPPLEKAYEDAKSAYLESAIAEIVRRAMPSAKVYEQVLWTDPETGKGYENDVVALIGNTIFLFEAKAGRIADAARRGGVLSLEKNFKELFVEPSEQAWRLQNYLDTHGPQASLRLKKTGQAVDLHLDRKKVVYKFSVCIEHFAALTSAKHYLRDLGLVTDGTAWAPVLSLGELQLIERFLDTEVSFFHYLTRRATIEELMDFDGDEADLLSMYLTNGLCVDKVALSGKKVIFRNTDAIVRKQREPRLNRTEVAVHGVQLSPMWAATVRELYSDTDMRHRFDIIQTILNQSPPALMYMERRIRRWRRGGSIGGQETMIARYEIGTQQFLVVVHPMKRITGVDAWRERSREIAYGLASMIGATDCAVFLQLRKSKRKTFDGVSFFRMGQRTKPSSSERPI
jgi:hypothetical protein